MIKPIRVRFKRLYKKSSFDQFIAPMLTSDSAGLYRVGRRWMKRPFARPALISSNYFKNGRRI